MEKKTSQWTEPITGRIMGSDGQILRVDKQINGLYLMISVEGWVP